MKGFDYSFADVVLEYGVTAFMLVSIVVVVFIVAIIISRRSIYPVKSQDILVDLPEADCQIQTNIEQFVCRRSSLDLTTIDAACLVTVEIPPKFDGFGAVLVNHKIENDVESGGGVLLSDLSRAYVRISAFKCIRNYGSTKKPVSFAEKCGLRLGDVIGAINGVCSNSPDDLVMLLLEVCRSGIPSITFYLPQRGPILQDRSISSDSKGPKTTRKSILAGLLPRSFSLENMKSSLQSTTATSLTSLAITALEIPDTIDFSSDYSQSSPRSVEADHAKERKQSKFRSMSPFRGFFGSKSPNSGLNNTSNSNFKPSLIRRALSKSTSTSSSF